MRKGLEWEGLVATPIVDLYDKRGNRIITKIKTRDYYNKEGERE